MVRGREEKESMVTCHVAQWAVRERLVPMMIFDVFVYDVVLESRKINSVGNHRRLLCVI